MGTDPNDKKISEGKKGIEFDEQKEGVNFQDDRANRPKRPVFLRALVVVDLLMMPFIMDR